MSVRLDLLAALPGLVADQIKTVLPGLQACKGMVGGFDLEELKRGGFPAPAVLVSRLGLEAVRPMGGPHRLFHINMAAFIVTRDAMGLPRDEAMGNIAAAILRIVPDANWGEPGIGPAEQVAERVLVNSAARNVTTNLAAVIWKQPIVLDPIPDCPKVPIQLYLGQAPRIGPGFEDHYWPVGEPG